MKEIIRIAVVDDDQIYTKAKSELINLVPNLTVQFYAFNGIELLEKLKETVHFPHVILLDLKMPKLDGLNATLKVKEYNSNIKVLISSLYEEEKILKTAIDCGADGVIKKNADISEIENAIAAVLNYGFYYSTNSINSIVNSNNINKIKSELPPFLSLNMNERLVLNHICNELTTIEIADELNLSPKSIERIRRNHILKTGARNVAGIVKFAYVNQMI